MIYYVLIEDSHFYFLSEDYTLCLEWSNSSINVKTKTKTRLIEIFLLWGMGGHYGLPVYYGSSSPKDAVMCIQKLPKTQ